MSDEPARISPLQKMVGNLIVYGFFGGGIFIAAGVGLLCAGAIEYFTSGATDGIGVVDPNPDRWKGRTTGFLVFGINERSIQK